MQFKTLGIALAIAGLTVTGAYAAEQGKAANSGAYCLESSASGASKNCTFATIAACNAAKKGASDKCARNPQATTGSGASQSSGSSSDSMKKK